MTELKKGEMLSKMLVIATNAHAGQFDKGGKTTFFIVLLL